MTIRLVVLSSYPPRRCGLATFSADLRAAVLSNAPAWRIGVCAIDRDSLSYGSDVVALITQTAARIAEQTGLVAPDRLVVIPHGVPVSLREPVDPARLGPELRGALGAADTCVAMATASLSQLLAYTLGCPVPEPPSW